MNENSDDIGSTIAKIFHPGEVLEGKFRQADTLEADFWAPVFDNTDFADFIKKQYKIGNPDQVEWDEIAEDA